MNEGGTVAGHGGSDAVPRSLLIGLSLTGATAALSLAAASFARFGGALHERRNLERMIESDLTTLSYDVPTWFLVTLMTLDAVWFLTALLWLVCAVTLWAVARHSVPARYVVVGSILLLVMPRAVVWLPVDTLWLPRQLMPIGVLLWAMLGVTGLATAALALTGLRRSRTAMSWSVTTRRR